MQYNNLLIYLNGKVTEGIVTVEQINNYQYPLGNFIQEIIKLRGKVEEQNIEAFCLLINKESTEYAKGKIRQYVEELFERLKEYDREQIIQNFETIIENEKEPIFKKFISIYLNSIIEKEELKFPKIVEIETPDEVVCLVMYFTVSYEEDRKQEINYIMQIFLERERPFYMGKQLMIQSFLPFARY